MLLKNASTYSRVEIKFIQIYYFKICLIVVVSADDLTRD